jgi:hypothetical protein
MELHDHLLLFFEDVAPLEIRPQVVDPPHPAALPAPQQPCSKQRWNDSSSSDRERGTKKPQLCKKNPLFRTDILGQRPTGAFPVLLDVPRQAVQVRGRVEAGAAVAEEGGVEPKVQPARRGGG